MSPANWTQLVVVLTVAALLAGLLAWRPGTRAVFAPACVLLLAAAGLVAALAPSLSSGRTPLTVLVVAAGALAAAGGGPVTARIFDFVDRGTSPSITDAGAVLRGGAWIGVLERLAVFAGLAAGFPEGVAIVLALKSVGRYPDLRSDAGSGAATERFIIGTFSSVLFAAGCAGLVALFRL